MNKYKMDQNIILDSTHFPETLFKELKELPPNQISMLLQLGYHIFKKNYVNISIDPNLSQEETLVSIGVDGEKYVENILSKEYVIQNTSKKNSCGDLLISNKISKQKNIYGKILVEVKNYSNPVPYKEVEKFKDDIKANNNIVGGLFISLTSRIQNIKESYLFTFVVGSSNIPVIYLCSSHSELIRVCAEMIWSLLEISSEKYLSIDNNINKISNKINKISDLLGTLSMSRTHINDTKDILQKQLSKIYENIFMTEIQIQKNIQSLYKYLPNENNKGKSFDDQTKLLDEFWKIIENIFPECLLLKDEKHKSGFLTIINFIINKTLVISSSEKRITFELDSNPFIIINPLKTKTNIEINIKILSDNKHLENLRIPLNCKYEDGWILFIIDKDILKNNAIETIINFIKLINS